MILVDNNILSTFARVRQLELLFRLFPKDSLGVPPAVFDELTEAVRLGCRFLESAAELIAQGRLRMVPRLRKRNGPLVLQASWRELSRS